LELTAGSTPLRQIDRHILDPTWSHTAMPTEAAPREPALAAQAERIMATFSRGGYEQIAMAVIQPAGPFLDSVGEALRARTHVFVDRDGQELCLRPDLTIPTCRLHLARHPGGNRLARYSYHGLAFRYQPGGATPNHPAEFRQAGIESFAASDREKEDAAILALTLEALRETGLKQIELTIGDLDVFAALLHAIPMPARWRRRLWHHFWRRDSFRRILMRLTSSEALKAHEVPRDLIGRLDPANPEAAGAIVIEYLERSGLTIYGTRTVPEMTERLLAAAADAREAPLDLAAAALIDSLTLVRTPATQAVRRLSDLLRPHKIDIEPALVSFKRRLDLLDGHGVDTREAEFSAVFGRSLEYYTGFVFQAVSPKLGATNPIASGGRYDGLLTDLGAPQPVPAIGSCIHTERLYAALHGDSP
jgi:ATP phosphoribosyltransferase regulatory subunit